MSKEVMKKTALIIGYAIGAWWLLFSILSHGLTMQAFSEYFIGGMILIFTQVGSKWEKTGGWLLIAYGVLATIFVLRNTIYGMYLPVTAILMFGFLALPPLVSGVLLMEYDHLMHKKVVPKAVKKKAVKKVVKKKAVKKKVVKKKAVRKVVKKKTAKKKK